MLILVLCLPLHGSPVFALRDQQAAESLPKRSGLEETLHQAGQAVATTTSPVALRVQGVRELLRTVGNTVPVVTPLMDSDGRLAVDRERARRYFRYLRNTMKVGAVLVVGKTGECDALGPDLRAQAIRVLTEEAHRITDWVVLTHVTGKDAVETLRNAQIAAAAGADALVLAPTAFLETDLKIELFVRKLWQTYPAWPILLYNNPALGRSLSPTLVSRLWTERCVAGLKDSSGEMAQFQAYLKTSIPMSQGDEGHLHEAMVAGEARGVVVRAVGSSGNFWPLVNEAATMSDAAAREAAQRVINETLPGITADGKIPAAVKYLLSRRTANYVSLVTPIVAASTPTLTPEQMARLDELTLPRLTGLEEREAAPIRILFADQPQREKVPGEVRSLIQSMNLEGTVELIEEMGESGNERKLLALIKKYKPTIIVVFTGRKILVGPYVVRAFLQHGGRLIIRAGAGYDNISMDNTVRYGVPFLRTHGLAVSMADFTLRFLFAGLRLKAGAQSDAQEADVSQDEQLRSAFQVSPDDFHEALRQANLRKRGEMTEEQRRLVFGTLSRREFEDLASDLRDRRIGILGFGAIGQEVARKLKEIKEFTRVSFEVVATSPSLLDSTSDQAKAARELGVRVVDEEELCRTSDIVSIHIPSTDANKRYVSPRSFSGRTRPLLLINTAREDLVDRALFQEKQPFQLTFFGDVDFDSEIEALRAAHPTTFFITPHIGGLTEASAQGALDNLLEALRRAFPVLLGKADPGSFPTTNRIQIEPLVSESDGDGKHPAGLEERRGFDDPRLRDSVLLAEEERARRDVRLEEMITTRVPNIGQQDAADEKRFTLLSEALFGYRVSGERKAPPGYFRTLAFLSSNVRDVCVRLAQTDRAMGFPQWIQFVEHLIEKFRAIGKENPSANEVVRAYEEAIRMTVSPPEFVIREILNRISTDIHFPPTFFRPDASSAGLEEGPSGMSRRAFLWAAGAAMPNAVLPHIALPGPTGALVPLRRWLGPQRQLGIVLRSPWSVHRLLTSHDFFPLAVKAGVDTVWLSGFRFSELPFRAQRAILLKASEAGLKTLGFIDGEPDWVHKPQHVYNRYQGLMAKLARITSLPKVDLDLGDLQFAFAVDIKPHTQPGWNGDLTGYVGLIEEVILPWIRAFDRNAILTRFEPWRYERGQPKVGGIAVRGLRPIQNTQLAGAAFYPVASSFILNEMEDVQRRAREEGTDFLIGVSSISNEAEGKIGSILFDGLALMGPEDVKRCRGVYILAEGPLHARELLHKFIQGGPDQTLIQRPRPFLAAGLEENFFVDGPARGLPNAFPEVFDGEVQRRIDFVVRWLEEKIRPRSDDINTREGKPVDRPGLRDQWPSDALREALWEAARVGLLGANIPVELRGDPQTTVVKSAEMAAISEENPSFALTLDVARALAPRVILESGDEQLQQELLPKVANGEIVMAYAITEPNHGTDVLNRKTLLETWARLGPDGKWHLHGAKHFITNGFADFFIVLASTDSTGEKSFFLVEAKDLEVTQVWTKIGFPGTHLVDFKIRRGAIPRLIGKRGDGIPLAFAALNHGRISIAAGATGLARSSLKELLRYVAAVRKVGGRPLSDLGTVRRAIAQMSAYTYAMESLLFHVSALVDAGQLHGGFETAIAKVWTTQVLNDRMVNEAVQKSGGIAYMPLNNRIARDWADARITTIFEGANDALAPQVIALFAMKYLEGEGARLGTFLSDWALPAKSPLQSESNTVKEAAQHVWEVAQATRTMEEGPAKQIYLETLGRMLTELYALTVTINRTQAHLDGSEESEQRVRLARLVVADGFKRIHNHRTSLDEIQLGLAAAEALIAAQRESGSQKGSYDVDTAIGFIEAQLHSEHSDLEWIYCSGEADPRLTRGVSLQEFPSLVEKVAGSSDGRVIITVAGDTLFVYPAVGLEEGAFTEEEKRFSLLDNQWISYRKMKPMGQGPHPVTIALHRYGSSNEEPALQVVARRLLQEGYAVILPDMRGHAAADNGNKSSSSPEAFSPDVNMEDVLLLVEHLSESDPDLNLRQLVLVGYSWGGFIARRVAALAYGGDTRFSKIRERGISLVVDMAGMIDPRGTFLRYLAKILKQETPQNGDLWSQVGALSTADERAHKALELSEQQGSLMINGHSVRYWLPDLEGHSAARDLGQIPNRVPYLFIVGQGDDLILGQPHTPEAREFMEAISRRGGQSAVYMRPGLRHEFVREGVSPDPLPRIADRIAKRLLPARLGMERLSLDAPEGITTVIEGNGIVISTMPLFSAESRSGSEPRRPHELRGVVTTVHFTDPSGAKHTLSLHHPRHKGQLVRASELHGSIVLGLLGLGPGEVTEAAIRRVWHSSRYPGQPPPVLESSLEVLKGKGLPPRIEEPLKLVVWLLERLGRIPEGISGSEAKRKRQVLFRGPSGDSSPLTLPDQRPFTQKNVNDLLQQVIESLPAIGVTDEEGTGWDVSFEALEAGRSTFHRLPEHDNVGVVDLPPPLLYRLRFQPVAASADLEEGKFDRAKVKVLLVEGDAAHRDKVGKMLADILTRMGVDSGTQLLKAGSAIGATPLIREAGKDLGFLLIDLGLTSGNASDVIRQARQASPSLAIVLMSDDGRTDGDLYVQGLKLNGLISKGELTQGLEALIRKHLPLLDPPSPDGGQGPAAARPPLSAGLEESGEGEGQRPEEAKGLRVPHPPERPVYLVGADAETLLLGLLQDGQEGQLKAYAGGSPLYGERGFWSPIRRIWDLIVDGPNYHLLHSHDQEALLLYIAADTPVMLLLDLTPAEVEKHGLRQGSVRELLSSQTLDSIRIPSSTERTENVPLYMDGLVTVTTQLLTLDGRLAKLGNPIEGATTTISFQGTSRTFHHTTADVQTIQRRHVAVLALIKLHHWRDVERAEHRTQLWQEVKKIFDVDTDSAKGVLQLLREAEQDGAGPLTITDLRQFAREGHPAVQSVIELADRLHLWQGEEPAQTLDLEGLARALAPVTPAGLEEGDSFSGMLEGAGFTLVPVASRDHERVYLSPDGLLTAWVRSKENTLTLRADVPFRKPTVDFGNSRFYLHDGVYRRRFEDGSETLGVRILDFSVSPDGSADQRREWSHKDDGLASLDEPWVTGLRFDEPTQTWVIETRAGVRPATLGVMVAKQDGTTEEVLFVQIQPAGVSTGLEEKGKGEGQKPEEVEVVSAAEFVERYSEAAHWMREGDERVFVMEGSLPFNLHAFPGVYASIEMKLRFWPDATVRFQLWSWPGLFYSGEPPQEMLEGPGLVVQAQSPRFLSDEVKSKIPLRVVDVTWNEAEALHPMAWVALALDRNLTIENILSKERPLRYRMETFEQGGKNYLAIIESA